MEVEFSFDHYQWTFFIYYNYHIKLFEINFYAILHCHLFLPRFWVAQIISGAHSILLEYCNMRGFLESIRVGTCKTPQTHKSIRVEKVWSLGLSGMRNDIYTCKLDVFATHYQLFFFSYQFFELKLPTFSTELPTSCSVQVSTFFSVTNFLN